MPFRARRRYVPILFLLLLFITIAAPSGLAQPALKADRILVLKSKRRLLLLHHGVVLKSYSIALGSHPRGPKRWEGDGRTPEGLYVIDGRLADSAYHLSLHISYPSEADRERALAAGKDPGGKIMIHGMPERFGYAEPARFFGDWTDGCIAVDNTAIEQIWNAVDDGTPIEIRP
jgi:murein L,D-transpeptidase YafK